MRDFLQQHMFRFIGLILVCTLLPLAPTQAYFSAGSFSAGSFSAGELVLSVGQQSTDGGLGVQKRHLSSGFGIEHSAQSINSELRLSAESVGSGVFCEALDLVLTRGSDEIEADIANLTFGPEAGTSTLQVFTLDFSLDPDNLLNVPHGAGCDVSLLVESVQSGVPTSELGFFDREQLTWRLKAEQVVLNEILADPGSKFVEFIELYNAGSVPVDVVGWTVTELSSSGNVVTHNIATTSTLSADLIAYDDSGTTIVPAGGYLALKFAGKVQYLNNDGDTIRLFDGSGTELDEYAYTTSLPGKSDARIPDGIGNWIDPIPTPGDKNRLESKLVDLSVELAMAQTTSTTTTKASSTSESVTVSDTKKTTNSDDTTSNEAELDSVISELETGTSTASTSKDEAITQEKNEKKASSTEFSQTDSELEVAPSVNEEETSEDEVEESVKSELPAVVPVEEAESSSVPEEEVKTEEGLTETQPKAESDETEPDEPASKPPVEDKTEESDAADTESPAETATNRETEESDV